MTAHAAQRHHGFSEMIVQEDCPDAHLRPSKGIRASDHMIPDRIILSRRSTASRHVEDGIRKFRDLDGAVAPRLECSIAANLLG